MDLSRRSAARRQLLLGAAALLAAPAVALAQPAFPSKPVRVIVPFPPGGTSDLVARLLADKLAAALGQPVVVESRPGANGIIASDFVARATDGHTLLFASAAHASNATLYPRLPYDSARDFVPVALVVAPGPMVIVAHPSLPAKNVAELIEAAKKNPGKIAYASAGIGNTLHLAGEMFGQMAGVQMLHVPYKGAAPALNDLMGGQVQLMFNSALAVAPQVKDGKLKLLAQTGAKRSPALPADLPTVAEAGLPGFEVTGWFGLFAPASLPPEAVKRLNAEVQRAMATPEARDKLVLLGSPEPPTLQPEAFAAFVDAETKRYAKVIRTANLSLDMPGNEGTRR
ncbi:MAG: tripartite tricarboxylate transporter substrate binding protein [Burkholderiales bacterium]|nr:tripartite tricarboxylate transporter substrate binding protein [Burkholderiales bacterium]